MKSTSVEISWGERLLCARTGLVRLPCVRLRGTGVRAGAGVFSLINEILPRGMSYGTPTAAGAMVCVSGVSGGLRIVAVS